MIDSRLSSKLLSVGLPITLASGILWMSACICFAKDGDAFDGHKDDTNETERPVIAAIQVEGGDLTLLMALLGERLSRNDSYVLVDREHIDKVVKEHELAALSAASSVSKRVALGRLLGADLLVLLSEHTSPKPHCEIVISETSRGLRLQVSKLSISDKPGNDSKAIEKEIENALKKEAEPFKAICAVLPFVSRDLSGTYEHLQGAYARMLEAMLLQIPGIVVVEIAEARAIAAETSLTGENVERSLPLYLVGEYRYDTVNPRMLPYVKITAHKGVRIVGSREAKELLPETAAPFLRKSVLELLRVALRGKLSEQDCIAECHSLSRRARVHFSIGHYEEAAQLAEASLLLEPRQPKIHHLAMSAYGRCCWQEKKDVTEALRYYDHALVHLEHFLRQSRFEKSDSAVFNSISQAFHETIYMTNDADEETKKAVHAHRQRARDMYISVIKARHNAGTLTDALLSMIFTRWLFEHDLYGETLRENLQKRLDVVPMLLDANVEHPRQFIRNLVEHGLPGHMKMTKEYSWFLDELSQYDNPAVKSIVDSERRLSNRLNAQKAQPRSSPNQKRSPAKDHVPKTLGHAEIAFVPIALERADRNASNRPFKLWGLTRCGERVDLVWGASGAKEVFLMETKGQLRQIFEADKKHAFGQAAFDGKYAWLPVTGPQSLVLAINPTTGSVVQFTSEDGLPVFQYAASASVGEGRLCLSAGFGHQTDRRAFIAVLELSKNGDKGVRIIHEATRQLLPDKSPSFQFRDPQMSYIPKFMISKPRDKENSWLAVLGRSMPGAQGRYPSLLIDPNAARVEVIDASVESHIVAGNVAFSENAAYWSTRKGLRCLRIDSKDSKVVRELPEEGRVMLYGGRLHVVGRQWWVADDRTKPFRKLSGRVPGSKTYLHQFFVSSHYGLVFRTSEGSWKNYQVVFRDVSGTE